jgi:hypothetical protein
MLPAAILVCKRVDPALRAQTWKQAGDQAENDPQRLDLDWRLVGVG